MTRSRIARGAALLALVLLPAILAAQEPAGETPVPAPVDHRARLSSALDRAEDAPLRVLGSVDLERPSGGLGAVVVAAGLGQGGPPFEGRFEAWSDGKGKLVVVSEEPLPGFEIFRSDERDLKRLTYEESPPGVDQLASDLGALLDMVRLRKWLRRADLEATVDPGSGATRFEGEAPRRLVPAGSAGVMGMPQAKVLRISVSLTLAADGSLAKATFRILRSDPVTSLLRRSNLLGGAGEPQEDTDEPEGGTAVYELSFGAADPSPRVRGFLRTAESLLSPKGK